MAAISVACVSSPQILLADAIDEQDEPADRLLLEYGHIRAPRQAYGCWSEIPPTAIKIDQVAWSGRLARRACRLFIVTVGSTHTERLMQDVAVDDVKKA